MYNEELIQEVKSYAEKNNLSDNKLANMLGISNGTLSLWMSKKYTGSIKNIEKKIRAFIDDEDERTSLYDINFALPFVETHVWKRYHEVARCSHLYKEFGVITARYGSGKTYSAQEYQRRYPNTLLFTARKSLTTKTLFKEMHKILCKGGKGILDNLFVDIVSVLTDSDKFIIIDEAEKLSVSALDMIRSVQEAAHVGVLLQGSPELIANMRGASGELGYIYDRVSLSVELDRLREADTKEIVTASLKVPHDANVYKSFHTTCKGNARKLEKLIKQAKRIAEINDNCEINAEIVNAAMEMLIK